MAGDESIPPQNFPDLPPFPSDAEISTAPLLRLSLQRLLDDEPAERQKLWDACCQLGFFYLDLRGAEGRCPAAGALSTESATAAHEISPQGDAAPLHDVKHVSEVVEAQDGVNGASTNGSHGSEEGVVSGNDFLTTADALFGAADDLFALPVAEKQQYDYAAQGSYFGYKGYGVAVVDKEGTSDRNEFYNVSKDDIFGQSARIPAPSVLEPHRPLLKHFMGTSHAIVRLVLSQLNHALKLPSGTLGEIHRLHAISGDQVRWVRSPPQPAQDQRTALGAHTDFGSVTLLFNRLGGLQILPPGKTLDSAAPNDWQYVRPLPGHCIVNLGDALVMFTRGLLRSNIHRVVNPPGEQAKSVRTSLVYFARPEDSVLLGPLEGSEIVDARKDPAEKEEERISSKDWIMRRALGGRIATKEGWEKARGTEALSARTTAAAAS